MIIKKFFGKEKTSKTFTTTTLPQLSLSELSHVSGGHGTGHGTGSGGDGRSLR
ncbi:MAG: hypothetical protein AB4372_21065 [Xenococcus sp. (in: cyanobacteria)]